MPEFTVVKDTQREKATGGRKVYTFLIDESPTLRWYPTEHAVRRAIERLKLGRSDVFGGPAIVVGSTRVGEARMKGQPPVRAQVYKGEPRKEKVTMKSGKEKEREVETFVAELDGEKVGEYPTEAEARCAAACAAWKAGGKLKHMEKAKAELEAAYPGCECDVFACPERHKIVATVDGEEHYVGITPDGEITVKVAEDSEDEAPKKETK